MRASLFKFWTDREQRVVASAFLTLSVSFGAWITRLPELQARLELSDAQLGTALFCLPIGAVTLLPFYSRLIHRLKESRATLLGAFILMFGLVLTTVSASFPVLLVALYFTGLGIGLMDVSMNAVAAEIEKQRKVQIMSACHGFFSIGGVIGASVSMLFIAISTPVWIELVLLAILFLFILLMQFQHLLISEELTKQPGFTLPPKSILGLAIIGICTMMAEGGITDWSTIYIERGFAVEGYLAGMGFAGFSLTMALGRFSGDALIIKYNGVKLIRMGISIGVLGLILIQLNHVAFAILGFSLAGLGLSLVVPIIFGKAAKTEGLSSAKGLASVASAGYLGWLIGPVTIGYISEWQGLNMSFIFITLLCILAILTSFRLR